MKKTKQNNASLLSKTILACTVSKYTLLFCREKSSRTNMDCRHCYYYYCYWFGAHDVLPVASRRVAISSRVTFQVHNIIKCITHKRALFLILTSTHLLTYMYRVHHEDFTFLRWILACLRKTLAVSCVMFVSMSRAVMTSRAYEDIIMYEYIVY